MLNDSKPRVHFVAPYLLNPLHRVSITLVGAGGTGSQMLSCLARTDSALRTLGHPGLHVTTYDPDSVEQTNIGRQLFCPQDTGLNKAECLTTRFNRVFGLDWVAEKRAFDPGQDACGNIVITCVDNIRTRLQVEDAFRTQKYSYYDEMKALYWLDTGNSRRSGQVILGSNEIEQPKSRKYSPVASLPTAPQVFDHYKDVDEKDSGPSCSLAEALGRQDLFINSSLAQTAGSLLWCLLKEPVIDIRGFYLNLEDFRMSPIKI